MSTSPCEQSGAVPPAMGHAPRLQLWLSGLGSQAAAWGELPHYHVALVSTIVGASGGNCLLKAHGVDTCHFAATQKCLGNCDPNLRVEVAEI